MTTNSSPRRLTRAQGARRNRLPIAFSVAAALALLLVASGCGLESDGSRSRPSGGPSAGDAPQGRYQTEVIRLGVPRPLFLLIDTATGGVEQRLILGNQMFKPIAEEPAPGADLDPKVPGRYDVKVTPGRRGSGLLRLDTVTGRTWFLQIGPDRPAWVEFERQNAPAEASSAGQAQAPDNAGASTRPGGAAPAIANARTGERVQRKIELRALEEVLLDPSQDIQLRVWTAKQAAELYPAETAELAADELFADDPKILIGIANTVELDPEGRVRAALQGLAKHADPKVIEAVAERIGGTP